MPTTKQKVHLQFHDIKSLIDFTLLIELTNCEVLRTQLILICELTAAEIELAVNGFRAIVQNFEY